MKQQVLYDDGLVQLDADGLTFRWYYFPFPLRKRIPYARIKGLEERRMGALTGKWRLWGSGDLRHWYPLDLRRPQKEKALVLDVGKSVRPVITPEDPERVLALLQEQMAHL